MSTIVPILNAESLTADAQSAKPVLRRRLIMAAVALVLIGGLAAVPLPARHAYAALLDEIADLQGVVDEFHTEDQQLNDWDLRLGDAPEDQAARAARWLVKVDPIALRNRLISVAGPCGLSLSSITIDEGLTPLGEGDVMDSLRTVLGAISGGAGAQASVDDPWGDDEMDGEGDGGDTSAPPSLPELPSLTATRYTISGRGPASGVLLFSGLLRQLPEPLRLLSLDLTFSDGGVRFTLVADRLSSPLSNAQLKGLS